MDFVIYVKLKYFMINSEIYFKMNHQQKYYNIMMVKIQYFIKVSMDIV